MVVLPQPEWPITQANWPRSMARLTPSNTVLVPPSASAAPGEKGHTHATFNAGKPGNPKKPARLVEIFAREGEGKMSYSPDAIEVKRGEQIRFVIKNEGALAHEFLLDSFEGNAKHKIQMEKNPEMEHDEPNGIRLEPKKDGGVLWIFDKVGKFEFPSKLSSRNSWASAPSFLMTKRICSPFWMTIRSGLKAIPESVSLIFTTTVFAG